jgi:ribulose 1,5-bisphosphate carboxylase large subunit-like protein
MEWDTPTRHHSAIGPRGLGEVRALGTIRRRHTLLHSAAFMCDMTAICLARIPLARCHRQVAAGHVLVIALFGGLGGLHSLGDWGAICLPGHCHRTWVEVIHQTNQCGLVGLELLRGRWK